MSYFEVVEAIVCRCWVNHVKGGGGLVSKVKRQEGNWKRSDILLLHLTATLHTELSAFMQITWLNVYSIVGPCKQTKRDHLTAINNGGQHQGKEKKA